MWPAPRALLLFAVSVALLETACTGPVDELGPLGGVDADPADAEVSSDRAVADSGLADAETRHDAALDGGFEDADGLDADPEDRGRRDAGPPDRPAIFYEPFEGLASIRANRGEFVGRPPAFGPGARGRGASFAGAVRVCYPLPAAFDPREGTVELWVNRSTQPTFGGVFDIGTLGRPRTWGLFRNLGRWFFEIRNGRDLVVQANPPSNIPPRSTWRLLTAVWAQRSGRTVFKLCLDGRCNPEFDASTVETGPSGDVFCVGWSGFYGYSNSQLDELRVFDFAKANAEVAEAFESLR